MVSRRGRLKARIALVVSALFFLVAMVVLALALHFWRAANPDPAPLGLPERAQVPVSSEAGDDAFPTVDWAYWQGVNPDVIGWITIPGTDVDHPILQAHDADKDYYLSHDVYGDYNPLGAIYLDAECEPLGLSSPNAVLLGHHTIGAEGVTGFGIIASYKDTDFAAAHSTVLIQTPTARLTYQVRFANIVKGWEPNKRTTFSGDADYREWYDSARDTATMVLDDTSEPTQTIALVSCSYNYWVKNERTVVTTSPDLPSTKAPSAQEAV